MGLGVPGPPCPARVSPPSPRALHLAVIHEHLEFLESILRHTERSPYLDLQNDLGQVGRRNLEGLWGKLGVMFWGDGDFLGWCFGVMAMF